MYKASHDFVQKANVKEVNAKVKDVDQRWQNALIKRDHAWEYAATYRWNAWKRFSRLYCLIPAAFPLFVPPFIPPMPIYLFITRISNDDCCWMWPVNGDCPICLIYGPGFLGYINMAFEAVQLAIFVLFGDSPMDRGCNPEEGPEACVGDGGYGQHTLEVAEDPLPTDIPDDEDDSGLKFDDPSPPKKQLKVPQPEEVNQYYDAPDGATRNIEVHAPTKSPAAKTKKSEYGYGDGDEGGGRNSKGLGSRTRNLGESVSLDRRQLASSIGRPVNWTAFRTATVSAVKGLQDSSRSFDHSTQGMVGQAEVPSQPRSTPGWHIRNTPWIVRKAVNAAVSKAGVEKHAPDTSGFGGSGHVEQADLKDWMMDVERVNHDDRLAQELQQKWRHLTPVQRRAFVHLKEESMTRSQRKSERRSKERQQKVSAFFVANDVEQRYTKVHVAMNIHPFDTLHGPLPGGWHVGRSSHGITYYWNDSGAKQLHLPTAPYLAQYYKAGAGGEFSPDKLDSAIRSELRKVAAINNLSTNGSGSVNRSAT